MPTIIIPFDFIGENAIAQVQSMLAVEQNVQLFIDKYEPKFLKALLGDGLYAEFIAGLAVLPTPETKWTDLRDNTDVKPMLINYIYYFYLRNITTNTAGTSEVKAKNENSSPVNSVDKQVRSWNEMVEMSRGFTLDTTIYPSYVKPKLSCYNHWSYGSCNCVNEIYKYQNTLNI